MTFVRLNSTQGCRTSPIGYYFRRERLQGLIAERLARTHPEPSNKARLAQAYAGAGRREDALRILAEVRGSAIHPLRVAYVYAELGEADAAFEWMEKAYERRSIALPWIGVYPAFDRIRSDPRFDDLLRRIGLPES